jgi:hypothetical protein
MPAGLTDNRSILQKADLALSDLLTDGGLLVPEQAQRFLRILIRKSVIMGMATVEPMRSPKKEINKIRFASRVLRAGQSGVALSEAERSKPDLSQVELDSKLFKAEVRLNNEVLEDSIERGNLRNTVMQLMTQAVSRDMEDILINGDTANADPFFAQFDGVLKQATSNVVDAGGVKLNKAILRDLQRVLPTEFLVNKLDMRYLTSTDADIDYRDTLADRATPGGDRALGAMANTEAIVGYTGVPVVPVPLFPGDRTDIPQAPGLTDVLFLDPKNIHVGVHREIRLETDKDISAGEVIMVITLRFDTKYAEETAVAKAINVLV